MNLNSALVTAVDDAFFAVTSTCSLDRDALDALAQRRSAAVVSALQSAGRGGMDMGEEWLYALCAASAAVEPPWWLPMNEAVSELSLEVGARGVRKLFTSKPSEKEVARVRRLGAVAVRVLGSVLAAGDDFGAEGQLLRGMLIASLGLPDDDQRLLNAERPMAPEALDGFVDVKPSVARSLIRGAFHAAMNDGIDPRQEQAIATIAGKLGLGLEDVNAARAVCRQLIDGAKPFGDACHDAIRYMLADDPTEAERLAVAATRLTLPLVHRREVIKALTVGGSVVLGRKHTLSRERREAVLALGWLATLRQDVCFSRRAELALRHDAIAADLGCDGAAAIRATLESHLEAALLAAQRSAS